MSIAACPRPVVSTALLVFTRCTLVVTVTSPVRKRRQIRKTGSRVLVLPLVSPPDTRRMTIENQEAAYAGEAQRSFTARAAQQQDAAAQHVRERTIERLRNEEAILDGAEGVAEVNDDFRLDLRLDRVNRYLRHEELPTKSGAVLAPDRTTVVESIGECLSDGEQIRDLTRVLEKIILSSDLVRTRYIEAGVRAARTVARVVIYNAGGRVAGYGTGSLVSPLLFLTNEHVLSSPSVARHARIEFDFQEDAEGRERDRKVFELDPDTFFAANWELDFALVAVKASREQLAEFSYNPLIDAQGTITIGDFVTIVQHPRGETKQLALRENKVVDIAPLWVHYVADTEAGSSGSPVFNDQWEVVALHHASVARPEKPQFGGYVNEGVRISKVIGYLQRAELTIEQRRLFAETTQHPPRPHEIGRL